VQEDDDQACPDAGPVSGRMPFFQAVLGKKQAILSRQGGPEPYFYDMFSGKDLDIILPCLF
jgi:hypothetical protein